MSYLNVNFQGTDPTRTILSKSFPGTLRQFNKVFENQFTGEIRKIKEKQKSQEWTYCLSNCRTVASKYVEIEINSTAYILRCLQMSMLNGKQLRLRFTGNVKDISGKWKEDKKMFKILNFGPIGRNSWLGKDGRLIMGFGPSASGKTYWANNLIQILAKMDKSFPDTFISVDGGIYREASNIYQQIVQTTLRVGIEGLNNLIPSGSSKKNELFPTRKVKKSIREYLAKQKTPNIYVPETLGGCLTRFDCQSKYSAYKKITNDKNWIGVCIWQHKFGKDCTFSPQFRCVGCTESGKEREKGEGKKYSNKAWGISYNNGITNAKRAKKWFIIHNAGGKKTGGSFNKSKIESNETIPTYIQNEYNFVQEKVVMGDKVVFKL